MMAQCYVALPRDFAITFFLVCSNNFFVFLCPACPPPASYDVVSEVCSTLRSILPLTHAHAHANKYTHLPVHLVYACTNGRSLLLSYSDSFQYIFLMYHYYAASETYNVIRVFITCYVWMTGFGNFSFFYIKRDFGISRVLQVKTYKSYTPCCTKCH